MSRFSRNIPPPELVSRLQQLRIIVAAVAVDEHPEALLDQADKLFEAIIEDIKIRDRDGGDLR